MPGLEGVVLHVPRGLVHGAYHLSTPATTVHSGTPGVTLLTQVSVNGHREPFKVDTGASNSAIDAAAQRRLTKGGAITTGIPQTLNGPFCTYTAQTIDDLDSGSRVRPSSRIRWS